VEGSQPMVRRLEDVLMALLCGKHRAHEDIRAGRNRAWTRFLDRAAAWSLVASSSAEA